MAFCFCQARADGQLARQNFPIDLGSGVIAGTLPFDEPFILSGPAPKELIAARLWAGSRLQRRDCSRLQLPPASLPGNPLTTSESALQRSDDSVDLMRAQRAAPMIIEPTSLWDRAGLDSVANFALEVGAIEPNRDYTFCFQLVRKPTDAEAAKFTTAAIENLTARLRQTAESTLTVPQQLDSLQAALIRGLPAADSIEVTDPHSVLSLRKNETEAGRLVRLNSLNVLWNNYVEHARRRKANLGDFRTHSVALNDALIATPWPLLGKLVRIASLADAARLEGGGVSAAAAAVRLSAMRVDPKSYKQTLNKVSIGVHSLDDPTADVSIPTLDTVWTASGVKPFDDNYKRTAEVVQRLRDLVAYAIASPVVSANDGINTRELLPVVPSLNRLLALVATQRNDLVNVASELDFAADTVAKLVATVRTYDLPRIGLRATTSTTYQARANMYISLDVGVLGAYQVREVVPYFGVNLYLRPVNKNMPLALCPVRRCLSRRFALTFGVTAASIKQEGRIDDLFNTHAILLGGGLRLTDFWRVTTGALLLKSFPDGPKNRGKITAKPSIATSIDIDIVSALGKFGGLLFPNLR